jgi:NAD(P)-dependent dehydrogenase (short-subunit alcohol dehydrogenase family)
MSGLEDRVALLTGAAAGIGRATARAFGKAGAKVVVTSRQVEAAQLVVDEIEAAGGTAIAFPLDTSGSQACTAAVDAAVRAYGKLDIVVHNATWRGFRKVAPNARYRANATTHQIDDIDRDYWDDQAAVSLNGSFYLARAAFPHLKGSDQGRLILFSSLRGILGLDSNPPYTVIKAAIRGFARSLAREWGPHGITVNVIAPASHSKASIEYFEANPIFRDTVNGRIPLGRLGDAPVDVAEAIVSLAGPAWQYLTGQTINLDGGVLSIT